MTDLARAYNIEDLRLMAKARLPKGLFEFVDRGVEDEHALSENRLAFNRIAFRTRTLRDVKARSAKTKFFGKESAYPMAVAPTGAVGVMWYGGEVAAARAAAAVGIPYTLSTASITSIEEVAEKAGGDLWFQLYAYPPLANTEKVVARAKAAGYRALIVTADTTSGSNREYNSRNGFSIPIKLSTRNFVDVMLHPRWIFTVMLRHLLSGGVPQFVNMPEQVRGDLIGRGNLRVAPGPMPITPEVIRRLRKIWSGPLLIKGILSPEDAVLAVDCGADGIVVSNHGGRSNDHSLATIEALPRILDAVGARTTVLLDSGIRRGSDVVKSLAMGAHGVLVGRAPLWGAAVAGEPGAHRALTILGTEIDRVMGQLGLSAISDIDKRCLCLRGEELSRVLEKQQHGMLGLAA